LSDKYNTDKSKLTEELKGKRKEKRKVVQDKIDALEKQYKADTAQLRAELLQMQKDMTNIEGNL
jgi:hypothetical protein